MPLERDIQDIRPGERPEKVCPLRRRTHHRDCKSAIGAVQEKILDKRHKWDSGPNEWLSEQQEQQGSWWPDWVTWLSEKSGERVAPPGMGNDKYTVLQKAPGSYVLEQ